MKLRHVLLCASAAAAGAACTSDSIPDRLGPAPSGDGPRVVFDTMRRPLPAVPLPNDVATFPDPTSRTGRRVNVSLVAPTAMEEQARRDFGSLEGWGTSAPISVQFSRADGDDPRQPAIDLEDVARRMQNDDHDFSNDPFYVVDLATGIPVFVDVGNGYYPVVVRDRDKYFPNDPKGAESNIVFETLEEGAGLTQAQYHPSLDKDFDGVLDHPNTLPTTLTKKGIPGVDDLMTWYERETDTLILRPLLPLEEKREYAVVLTDRLRGQKRGSVRSPFDAIHHPAQRASVARLGDALADKRLERYYGDLAGTGLDHVAFAWTFTTQPIAEDMHILRDGLYGKGPFARFARENPPALKVFPAAGKSENPSDLPGWQTQGEICARRAKTPFIVRPNDPDVRKTFEDVFAEVYSFGKGEIKAIFEAFQYIDHFVVGSFRSPYLMGPLGAKDPDTRFNVNFVTGEGDVRSDDVTYFIVVPKAGPGMAQPFPVSFWGHGATGHSDEIMLYAGDFARQGIALVAYNNPEHGAVFSSAEKAVATGKLDGNCLVPFISAFQQGRARDVTGDGLADSGAYWWTAHIFHTRDNVRQGLLDAMQFVRVLKSFDGKTLSTQDFDGDGKPNLAGDFDADGIPDVGGPNAKYFSAGESLGGIMSELLGGLEPSMVASAPMSGGGVIAMDVGFRSYGVVDAVIGQVMGPFVFALPAGERPTKAKIDRARAASACSEGQRSVRLHLNDATDGYEMEVACLKPDELGPDMTVVVTNVATKQVRCSGTSSDGRFRVPIPTSIDDKLDIQIYPGKDLVDSYGTCKVPAGTAPGRRINTWEKAILQPNPVADGEKTRCESEGGCAQFRDRFFPVGSPLTAPNAGLGLRRQTPELRRLRDLAQAGIDAADPFNFAPYYFRKPLFDEEGRRVPPHALLSINTVGDNFVQVAAGLSFARAAGALPFLPPGALARYPEYADFVTPEGLYEKLGRRTPSQAAAENGVTEAIPRLGRTSAGPACKRNYVEKSELCTSTGTINPRDCAEALFDIDWVSEGKMRIDQPHPPVPMRLGRLAGGAITDAQSLARAWEPRLRGVPMSNDDAAWTAHSPVIALFNNYIEPDGAHTWNVGDACLAFDYATYGNALMARFFATEGKDVYYLSHPATHGCLATGTCPFLRKSP